MDARHTDGTDREKRWMILAATGQHSWMGRHSDPSEEELAKASAQLAALGMDAWLCIAEGNYWAAGYYAVLEVRPLHGNGDFDKALQTFLTKRSQALAQA